MIYGYFLNKKVNLLISKNTLLRARESASLTIEFPVQVTEADLPFLKSVVEEEVSKPDRFNMTVPVMNAEIHKGKLVVMALPPARNTQKLEGAAKEKSLRDYFSERNKQFVKQTFAFCFEFKRPLTLDFKDAGIVLTVSDKPLVEHLIKAVATPDMTSPLDFMRADMGDATVDVKKGMAVIRFK